ncbi:MAG: ABC-F family ATP-binding cassette domain-containing protein [Campylobacter sputorum]|uniref:ABC-F family ATP-binding cassette domain-containing protein n=1 Tax=Campylobacter sputorum TaxID=206 RepID=UPI000B77E283|nr:ABC-F family ATP-binding cassette domain-containing protein [Campylobacter sputorum]ASM38272.1 ABC transporter, ATP-binding protein [Campylobacter sputorum bv. paraureolyticus LMG 11764]MDY6120945.1 ABC-F family ATP-binding cassette domain-containing protein [Campylobacter sputorum]
MAIIDIIDGSKKFGSKVILDAINFSINDKERIAIIGKNGGGKSTLMKILCSIYSLDDGRVITQNGVNIQMFSQNPSFDENMSIKEVLKKELDEIFEARKEYEKTLHLISENTNNKELLATSDRLMKFIESKDGWNIENKIQRVLENFKLKEFENRAIMSLSGGEIRRAALGALILKKPDVMLLDEPTNHLDVYMVKFLEDMLLSSNQTIVFISHDRYFIDKIATRVVEIEDGKIMSFSGGYSNYLIKKQEMLESLAKTHETLLKQLKSEEEWLRRGVKARLKRNEGRKQRVFAMREEAKKNPSIIRKVKLELQRATQNFSQSSSQNRKKMLFECKNISKTLGGKKLIDDFSTRVLQGERIGIVGRNGSGKSTLLKLLLGEIELDSGEIKRGDINIGYFDQTRRNIDEDKSLIENFCPNGGDHIMVKGHFMHVFGYLKNFLFQFLDQPVSTLSGGEKNRLALAKLFTKEYECLILDEPTNDLDIATINILEDYLLNFSGAVIIVSHDRYFVDKLSTKLWVFEDGVINQTHMAYSEYLEYEDELKEIDEISSNLQNEEIKQKQKSNAIKLSYKQNKILEEHPVLIENIENKIKELNHALSTPQIYQEIGLEKLYHELEDYKKQLEKLENEYFEVLEFKENLS